MDKRDFIKGLGGGMFSIFGEVIKTPKKPYYPFSGAPRQVTEPKNQLNKVPGQSGIGGGVGTAIMDAFNKIPIWFNNALLPAINPIVDASIDWPANIVINNFDYIKPAIPVASDSIIAQPNINQHILVLNLWFFITAAVTGIFQVSVLDTTDSSLTLQIPIFFTNPPAGIPSSYPIIGGSVFNRETAADFPSHFLSGCKPLYIRHPYALNARYIGQTGDAVTLRSISLTLPANQPFSGIWKA